MVIDQTLVGELIVSLVGIFAGMLSALALDRHSEKKKKQKKAKIILRSVRKELKENYKAMKNVLPAFTSTAYGQSFYISVLAWETALAGRDLPEIIGFELTDAISTHYTYLVKARHYGNLMTRLWFSSHDIPGYKEKQRGFNSAIVETMEKAIKNHPRLMKQINERVPEEY